MTTGRNALRYILIGVVVLLLIWLTAQWFQSRHQAHQLTDLNTRMTAVEQRSAELQARLMERSSYR